MNENRKAKVINGSSNRFKVGQIVTLVEETTNEYYHEGQEIEERYYAFVDENGTKQDLSDDTDFEWVE